MLARATAASYASSNRIPDRVSRDGYQTGKIANHRGRTRAMQIAADFDSESAYNAAHVRVLFVIGSEQVPRNTARTAVEQLLGTKATIFGAVLNRVNVRKNPYYYSHYYKHEYAGYYSAEKTA